MTAPTPRETAAESLNDLLAKAVEHVKAMTPEERKAMFERQKKAWVAAEMAIGDEGTRVVTGHRETSDHAELARRLREDADWQRKMKGGTTNDRTLDQAADALESLLSEIAALRGERDRLRMVVSKSNEEICQSLGKALGYPWFKDDQANFPGSTETDGVCVGDHVAESIADEAARRLTQAERQSDELREELEFIKGVVTPDQGSSMTDIERVIFARISRILANQGADQ